MPIVPPEIMKQRYQVYRNRYQEYIKKGELPNVAMAKTAVDYNISTMTVYNALRNRPSKQRTTDTVRKVNRKK